MTISTDIPFYEQKYFYSLIGAFIALVTFVVGQIISTYKQKKENKRVLLITLTQNNKELFNLIFQGSIDKEKIDYNKIRKCLLDNSGIIYILPKDLQHDFSELLRIYLHNPTKYYETKKDIPNLLSNITKTLKKYGVDTIG